MRGRIVIFLGLCALGLALAGCSSSGGGDKAADATQPVKTVTVTVPASDSGSGDARRGDSSEGTVTEKAPAADPPKRAATKNAPAPQSGTKKNGPGYSVPPGQVAATNGSPPEVTLAVIDEKSASVKKSTVRRYAVLLDRLEPPCQESREQLAESALTASHDTQGKKTRLSILDVLDEVAASHPSGECIAAFTRVSR